MSTTRAMSKLNRVAHLSHLIVPEATHYPATEVRRINRVATATKGFLTAAPAGPAVALAKTVAARASVAAPSPGAALASAARKMSLRSASRAAPTHAFKAPKSPIKKSRAAAGTARAYAMQARAIQSSVIMGGKQPTIASQILGTAPTMTGSLTLTGASSAAPSRGSPPRAAAAAVARANRLAPVSRQIGHGRSVGAPPRNALARSLPVRFDARPGVMRQQR